MIGKEVLNYRITTLIGKGGMGSVYLAEHKLISKEKVAIKIINANMANDFTRKLLQEEAEHLAGLNHPNIVSFKNYHIDEKGNIYLIMEYANGKNLEQYINEVSGLIVEDRICPLFEPILDAVGYAHKKHILHRDIKPANVVITTEGIPKILDFGIAKIIKNQQEEEKDNLVMGTPSYMSPEQVKGEHLDERSDIYSLGVLLHQMLTGNAPYDTITLTEQEINMKVVEEPLPRMRTFYKYVSEKVQKVVDKATAKDPNDRYQNCEEFKKELHRAIYPWKPKTWMKCAIVSVVALMIGCGIYVWDYNRVKVSYFKDYVERWGVPEGVGEVSSDDHTHMNRCYKFVEQRRKLLSVAHVNSLDHLIDDGESERNERPIFQEFTYTEEGKVSRVKVKDRCGKVLYVKSYNDKLNVMAFQYDDTHNTERTISNSTVGYGRILEDNNNSNGRISRWWIDYDNKGFAKSIRYHSLDNSAVGDANGIYGRNFVRDDKGRPVEIHYVGIDNKPQSTKWGLGIKKFEYDAKDNWVRAIYLTVDGKTAFDDIDGVAIFSLEYDKYGNLVNAYHQNGDGKPMLPKKSYVAGIRYIYNDKGQEVETTYLDVELKPMFVRGQGIAIVKSKYDDNGYVIKKSFYDPLGNLVNSNEGSAGFEFVNDDKGNVLESWTKDSQGRLCETDYGTAGYKSEYDSIGNMTKRIFYGKDKNAALTKDGHAGYIYKYNNLNLISEITYLGKDLNPAPDNNNVVIAKYDYDKRGNIVKCAFYEADGKNLRLSNENIAGWTSVYDDKGNELERGFFDKEEKLVMSGVLHCAKKKYTYDENGNLNSIRYLNVDGNLTLIDGMAGIEYVNDKRGNILQSKPIGVNGNLAKNKLITRYKYDEFDNEIEMALFDKKGAALNSYDVHKYVYIYNSRNQIIERRYYGKDGKLTINSDEKCAIEKYGYDDKGQRERMSYHGMDGKPCNNYEGWSSATYEHDVFGNITKQCFFDIHGKPTDPKVMVPVGIVQYDKWGNMIYLAALDGNNKLIINPNTGWSIMRAEYNVSGKVLMQAYYSEKDKPIINKELKYHKVTKTYDKKGQLLSEEYWKNENEPMSVGGVHKKFYEYDKNGNNIVISYWNTLNKPTIVGGYHKIRYKYNESGQNIEYAYYGTNGNRAAGEYGIHRVTMKYADDGVTVLYSSFYDIYNKLMLSQKWNGSEWIVIENRMGLPGNSDWKKTLHVLNEELPIDLGENGDNLKAESLRVTGTNSYAFYFSIPYSKYEISKERLNNYILYVESFFVEFKKEFKKELKSSSVPRGTCILLDSKKRELYRTN